MVVDRWAGLASIAGEVSMGRRVVVWVVLLVALVTTATAKATANGQGKYPGKYIGKRRLWAPNSNPQKGHGDTAIPWEK